MIHLVIGTTNPGAALHISNGNDSASGEFIGLILGGTNPANARTASLIKDTTTFDLIYRNNNFSSVSGSHVFRNGNSEHARIDSSGRLLIGTSTARANLFNSTIAPAIQLEGAGIVPAQRFLSVINNYATAGDGGGVIVLGRSKGGTVGSNTVVAADDQLGRFDFQGNDGTDFVPGATIQGYRRRHPWRQRHARPSSVLHYGGWGEFSDGADEDWAVRIHEAKQQWQLHWGRLLLITKSLETPDRDP
jgi:hypothetical protein